MKSNQKYNEISTTKISDSFDVRFVRYEYIHTVKDEYLDELYKILNPQPDENILDIGCGYGFVTKQIINRTPSKNLILSLADSNTTQLQRAKDEISTISNTHKSKIIFYHDNILSTKLPVNTFDKIVAKMIIHEIPLKYQQKAIDNLFKLLKPGGKLIIWDMTLNQDTQKLIQDIIRMKDKLAGFRSLEKNRYFLRLDEICSLLSYSGFSFIKKEYEINSPIITRKRLEQEFNNNELKLAKWHIYIRNRVKNIDPNILKFIKFEDKGDSISLTPHKGIISAIK